MKNNELIKLINNIEPATRERTDAARLYFNRIAKPLYSLGMLELAVARLAGMNELLREYKKCAVVMCADNGVVAEGVTQTGSEVTAVVAKNITLGKASICCFSRIAGADVLPVDIGMQSDVSGVRSIKLAYGTGNIARGPAMSYADAEEIILRGIKLTGELYENGYRMISAGEMGIGNTTTASAVSAVLLGLSPRVTTGRGAGLDADGLERKIKAVERAIEINKPDSADAVDVLSKIGGFDIAGMTGLFLGGAIYKIPVIIDGVISSAAALAAKKICPESADYMIASHMSAEPAAKTIMQELGLVPLLNIGMALGEGTGAVSVMPLLDMALSEYFDMPTFDETDIEEYKPL